MSEHFCFMSEYFCFSLSLSIHQCSIAISSSQLLSKEVQFGETWRPSDKNYAVLEIGGASRKKRTVIVFQVSLCRLWRNDLSVSKRGINVPNKA
jgi:hypothetical protein